MRNLLRRASLLASIGALAFGMSACGDDDPDPNNGNGSGGGGGNGGGGNGGGGNGGGGDVKPYDPDMCPDFVQAHASSWSNTNPDPIADIIVDGCYFVEDLIETVHNFTILPGSKLYFDKWAGVNVSGTFTAEGTKAKPILLAGAEHEPGFWHGIIIATTDGSESKLNHVTIDGAGRDSKTTSLWGFAEPGNLRLAQISGEKEPVKVSIENSTFTNSATNGVWSSSATELLSFKNNTLTKNKEAAAHVPIHLLTHFKSDSKFTGNTNDRIIIEADSTYEEVVLSNLSVVYQVLSEQIYFMSPLSGLTIEPGVTVEFGSRALLAMLNGSYLVAEGTQKSPITLKGIESTPGAWQGLYFSTGSADGLDEDMRAIRGSSLKHVSILHGGGGHSSDNIGQANLTLRNGWVEPLEVSLKNVTLEESDKHELLIRNAVTLTACENINITADDIDGDGKAHAVEICGL